MVARAISLCHGSGEFTLASSKTTRARGSFSGPTFSFQPGKTPLMLLFTLLFVLYDSRLDTESDPLSTSPNPARWGAPPSPLMTHNYSLEPRPLLQSPHNLQIALSRANPHVENTYLRSWLELVWLPLFPSLMGMTRCSPGNEGCTYRYSSPSLSLFDFSIRQKYGAS